MSEDKQQGTFGGYSQQDNNAAPSTPAPEPDYRVQAEALVAEWAERYDVKLLAYKWFALHEAIAIVLRSAVEAAVKERDRVTVAHLHKKQAQFYAEGNSDVAIQFKLVRLEIERGDHLPKET